LVYTPAVFVRVTNKGLAGYATWKSIRKMGDRGLGIYAEIAENAEFTETRGGMASHE
jgi:hypothetical protein